MLDTVVCSPDSRVPQSQPAVFKQTFDSSLTEDTEEHEDTEKDGYADNNEESEDDGNGVDRRIAYVFEEDDESDGNSKEGEGLNPLVEIEAEKNPLIHAIIKCGRNDKTHTWLLIRCMYVRPIGIGRPG